MAIKILQISKITPTTPPPSTTTSTIPLTFFDLPWLFFPPNQPLFFYTHPNTSTSHFITHSLPSLKHTLSLTLQIFPLFSSTLSLSPPRPHFTPNDAVSLTLAESTTSDNDFNFHVITQHLPKPASLFHSLIPPLQSSTLSVQITLFPGSGFSLGFSYLHVAADLRTFNNFIKTWSFLCRESLNGRLVSNNGFITSLPAFSRSVILDRFGLEDVFLNQWLPSQMQLKTHQNDAEEDKSGRIRASFVVDPAHMSLIKERILTICVEKHLDRPVHLSPSVLTGSLVWVCLAKTTFENSGLAEGPSYLGFNAGGVARLGYPELYIGNCIGFGRAKVMREDLLGESGLVVAAHAFGNTVKELDKDFFVGSERWVSDWEVMIGSDEHVMVSGSPKVDLYYTDFGFGRPVKIEEVSIDGKKGISLVESREFEGGIEVGLVLSKACMESFVSHFDECLKPTHAY